ncbi:hypothetical protein AMJ44_09365 [candidate division WOR-1 bacterium DG_54_3]|uniref:CHASE2 domain-containing protein n=1 Tax=candidate division WOR-1 bacterium DG_54_3 TaxID=1703775 RepID=A0A0S7XTN2_UNCSA|nr:MAG: hypothetical protein AMJ44_09365 [candidate division WOR-1 bacterium DG_54_3]
MNFYERMMNLDRRWVYLVIGVVVVVTAIWTFRVPLYVTPEARSVYDFVESLTPGEVLMIGVDYDPSALAELHPMSYAITRQCFSKDVKLLLCCLHQNGPGMVEQVIAQVAEEYGKVNGVDYVYLGYKPYPSITILAMGQNFRIPFPEDYYGTPLDSLPMMRTITNYDNVRAIINISAGSATEYWINYANGRYNAKLAIGVTGVMTSDYYPFLQSGQIFGLIGGMKGASEYEYLAEKGGYISKEKDQLIASKSMPIQTTTHIVIILFIVIGNIGYFMTKGKK